MRRARLLAGDTRLRHRCRQTDGLAGSRPLQGRIESTADLIHLNAFPSGHTAVTLVYLAILFVESRRLAWIFLPLVAGLIVATVALRYHYLIDVVAGVVVAAAWIFVGMPAVFRFDSRPRGGAAAEASPEGPAPR